MRKRQGFTLIEMLVVIGIIAILTAALAFGFSKFTKTADKAKDQELVSNVATALQYVLQKNNGVWPKAILNGVGGAKLDANVCKAFVRYDVLGLSYDAKTYQNGAGSVQLTGRNKIGLLNVYGQKNCISVRGETTGSAQEYLLRYAVDTDGDGITEVKSESGTIRVRATAAVWSCGPDGTEALSDRAHNDDCASWSKAQEVK